MNRCECCGVPVGELGCLLCVGCPPGGVALHGDRLEEFLRELVARGGAPGWQGLAVMATDDAHLCGVLELRKRMHIGDCPMTNWPRSPHDVCVCADAQDPDEERDYPEGGDVRDLYVQRCPPPWERYACRAFARGEAPPIGDVVYRAIAQFFGQANTAAVRAAIEREVLTALVFLDPDIVDVRIAVTAPVVRDGGEVRVEITKRTNVEPGAVLLSPTIEIPPEVLARKPAQA